jgi:hypothetical protein
MIVNHQSIWFPDLFDAPLKYLPLLLESILLQDKRNIALDLGIESKQILIVCDALHVLLAIVVMHWQFHHTASDIYLPQ